MSSKDEGLRRGALGDHLRRGKKFVPPMAQLPLSIVDSYKSEAPDFVWPILLWTVGGDTLVQSFVRLQTDLSDRLGPDETKDPYSADLDGRLSTLERWSDKQRDLQKEFLIQRIEFHGVLPDVLLALLRLYDGVPGGWLLIEPWRSKAADVAPHIALETLARGLAEWAKGDHLNAVAKYLTFTWKGPLRRTMSLGPEMVELLKDYPTVASKREATESAIRAGYGSLQGLLAYENDPSMLTAATWAKNFWAANWKMSGCLPEDSVSVEHHPAARSDREDTDHSGESLSESSTGPTSADHSEFVHTMMHELKKELTRFSNAYFGTARDLFDSELDEVVSGLTMRAMKSVAALIRAPHQWSTPFGAGTCRILAETQILLAWFRLHPEDATAYQEYGRGRDKLAWLHIEDLIASFGDDVPQELQQIVDQIDARKRDEELDVTVVNLEATFNGISMRKMAEEAGQSSVYRTIYQNSSGVLHGEWGAVELFDMTRCLNPLHRFHMIPSLQPPWIEDRKFPRILLNALRHIVSDSIAILRPEGEEDDSQDDPG